MDRLAPGSLLAQISGDLTTATTAIATGNLNREIHFITVQVDQNCNCTLYHDDDGTTYALSTQIWFEARTVALNKEAIYYEARPIIYVSKIGTLGVKCSVASAATFSFYGVTQIAR